MGCVEDSGHGSHIAREQPEAPVVKLWRKQCMARVGMDVGVELAVD